MRNQGFSKYFKTAIVLCLGISLYQFLAVDELQSAEDAPKPSPAPSTQASPNLSKDPSRSQSKVRSSGSSLKEDPSSYLVSVVAVKDLQKQREELRDKQKELLAKENELQQREKSVSEELKKLDAVRVSIEKTQEASDKEKSEKINRLVETVLTMSPKAAAKLLGSVNDELAVSVMNQMDTTRLGKVLNVMDAQTSSKLSELMTGVMKSKKGGELSYANKEGTRSNQSTDTKPDLNSKGFENVGK